MSLLSDVRKISRKSRASALQAKKEDYQNRIQKRMMKLAAEGEKVYSLQKVPRRRECLAADPELFISIAKHFNSLGFVTEYEQGDGSDKSRRKFGKPISSYEILDIYWD